MQKIVNRNKNRLKRHRRIRNKISGTAQRPRLNVFRSNKNIYVQVIDDEKGHTLASASTLEKDFRENNTSTKDKAAARAIGNLVGKRAIEEGIEEVVFDRGGYLYTGCVKEIADGAREAGLKF